MERMASSPSADPAAEAGLRYSTDQHPGIRRRRAGRGFGYRHPDGTRVTDDRILDRIRRLAVPPAWSDVWICPDPRGHLQATGRDVRGRKQYRYHPAWRAHRDAGKYERIVAFGRALPRIRRRVAADLRRHGVPRDKVLAAVVRLLELTLIRVGNDEYARLNRSFGLTTLRERHATVRGERIRFRFTAKGGASHEVGLRDRRLASLVRRLQDLPGQELFRYETADGEVADLSSDDVNAYLRDASGGDFTAKDFRTWAGTVLAYRALAALTPASGVTNPRRGLVAAIRQTAGHLGNTDAVARASYIHPAVLDSYLDGDIGPALVRAVEQEDTPPHPPTRREELAVIRLLERKARRA